MRYVDPDGKFVNVVVGAAIGFISSAASEVGCRMISGQNFTDAVKNTFTDKTSLAIIGASTLIGAATSGVSGLAVNATAKTVTTAASLSAKTGIQAIGEIAVKTTAINALSGAIDAGAKDIVTHTIKGEAESLGDVGMTMLKGGLSAALSSGFSEGVIAANSKATGEIGNLLTGTMKNFNLNQPKWTGWFGNLGENIIPTAVDLGKEVNHVITKQLEVE